MIISFKICFFAKYFRQQLLSLVNMGLHAEIIRLSPLIHEGEQRYKPYIVGDPQMVTPSLKNSRYAHEYVSICMSRNLNKVPYMDPLTRPD